MARMETFPHEGTWVLQRRGRGVQTTSRHCLHQCGFKPIVSHRLSASISTLGLHTSETSFCRCVAWLLVETTQSGTIDFIPHQRKGCFGEVCPGHAAGRWTERMRRGRTAASPLCHDFNSVRLYACSALAGLERLPADLCRPLGAVSTRPSALPDGVLRWPGGQDACVRQPRENGVHRVPLLAVWSGQAPGGDALSILIVL